VTVGIANNFYVDNVVTGCATDTKAIEYYTEARATLSLTCEHGLQIVTHDGANDNDDATKVLGLLWHTPSDTISLASQITVEHIPVTKHEILQNSSAIFDPLGFISPVTIQDLLSYLVPGTL